jgi:hypothetical protein
MPFVPQLYFSGQESKEKDGTTFVFVLRISGAGIDCSQHLQNFIKPIEVLREP